MCHHSPKKSTFVFFFISCFTISVAASIKRSDFPSVSTILMISSIPSFEISKLNAFPAHTTPLPLIFLSSLFIAEEVAIDANLGKTS